MCTFLVLGFFSADSRVSVFILISHLTMRRVIHYAMKKPFITPVNSEAAVYWGCFSKVIDACCCFSGVRIIGQTTKKPCYLL